MLPHRFVDGRNERGKRIFAGKVIQKMKDASKERR